jgi:hypothetical protein
MYHHTPSLVSPIRTLIPVSRVPLSPNHLPIPSLGMTEYDFGRLSDSIRVKSIVRTTVEEQNLGYPNFYGLGGRGPAWGRGDRREGGSQERKGALEKDRGTK